jgi:hypothetical protein
VSTLATGSSWSCLNQYSRTNIVKLSGHSQLISDSVFFLKPTAGRQKASFRTSMTYCVLTCRVELFVWLGMAVRLVSGRIGGEFVSHDTGNSAVKSFTVS